MESGLALPETGIVVPELPEMTTEGMVSFAVEAERAGAGSIWVSEGWGYGPFGLLGRIAEATDCPLGTGIANAFARSPAATAMEALALHEATGGRFVLGLGTGSPSTATGIHGTAFDRPVRRLRETIEIVRLALSGEPIEYEGVVFEVEGHGLDSLDGPVDVPVVSAALGPTNVAMALDHADGIVTYLLPFDRIPAALEAGRNRAHRPSDVDVVAQVPTCVSADPRKARALLRRHLAYYVGEVDAYNDAVSRHGFGAVARRIRGAWGSGDHDAAREAVTRELMDAIGIVGTPERARERLAEVLNGPVDTAVLSLPTGVDSEMRREALAVLAR